MLSECVLCLSAFGPAHIDLLEYKPALSPRPAAETETDIRAEDLLPPHSFFKPSPPPSPSAFSSSFYCNADQQQLSGGGNFKQEAASVLDGQFLGDEEMRRIVRGLCDRIEWLENLVIEERLLKIEKALFATSS
ncbi:hypothetical protein BOTBODRAFT_41864 [Botryobasidium botryosum FD-172 SS1]|uniref:Uncharacterized protein n=1 Tax=Botryobasidium botryosum (strain FD-172 SS1) TaxID=930990 RepID=A0A067MVZ7_BOTB1|nr:hypothetical protein BOTBODRAFT_41864 [Botryobasidium botryosum FD-172 SS1]